MHPPLEFWFDFASPYSHVGALRVEASCAAAGLPFVWRPFLLGPIFQAQGFATSPFNTQPARKAYMWRDLERLCVKYGLPAFKAPAVFPQRSVLVNRLGCALLGHPRCGDFVRAAFTAEFSAGLDLNEAPVLARVLGQLGLEAAPWLEKAESPEVKAQLRSFTDEAGRRGVFGAPNLFMGDELFFGQDRLEDAIAWARAQP
jgi:2-hydroxychromene-2-carboxylate isomerase